MQKKIKSKRKIIRYIAPILAILVLGIIVIPPMIHLNFLKDKIENVILSKTGIPAKIHGDINISLLGNATIVAHNLTVPNGVISSCEFKIPFFDIFNIKNATISDDVIISGASFSVQKIVPFELNIPITIKDSKIQFLDKEYKIIDADLSKHNTYAIIRTDQHKYEIKSENNIFTIKNKNNDLNLTGKLLHDGTAKGRISIVAQDINKWFEFKTPHITGRIPFRADVTWNGSYGFNFNNISAGNIYGDIQLHEDGYRTINLKSDNADYNMAFLIKHPEIFKRATLNLDFNGKIKFQNKTFKHFKLETVGTGDKIKIGTIIADDLKIVGGTIDATGAHNAEIFFHDAGVPIYCIFDGTPKEWTCDNFKYSDYVTGRLEINEDHFFAIIRSKKTIPNIKLVVHITEYIGEKGSVKFEFADMSGTVYVNKDKYYVKYDRLDNRTLHQAKIDLPFLPEFMQKDPGNFIWDKDSMIFIPNSKTWILSMNGDSFLLRGDDFKKWFPDLDLQSLQDQQYKISGTYKNGNISNLIIDIAEHKFVGSASKKSVTLKTDLLNMDYFIDQEFKKNYEELSFFTNAPILIPFNLNVNIALSAKSMIYNNKRYNNFVYSLHDNVQTFSISDSNRGNLLATLTKNNTKYGINIQLNKFLIDKKLLPNNMPLNISDTMLTAEIKLKTFGKIAHDIFSNINGTFDASFDGGYLYGIGLDDFYAFAPNITTLNAEKTLYKSLNDGVTQIKKMHIIGTYDNGDVKTIKPFTLLMKHVDAIGNFEISDKKMFTKINMVLRGTSPGPEPIELIVYPDNTRDFSLSEIMMHFDPEYMRSFIQSHNQF